MKKDKKKKLTKEEKQEIARKQSFQERIPIKDIKNRLYVTKDDQFLPVFSIGQRAVDLMSEEESYEFSKQLDTVFQTLGLVTSQFLLLPVPFDLQPYQTNQDKRYKELQEETRKLKLEEQNLWAKLNDERTSPEEFKRYEIEYDAIKKELEQKEACIKFIVEQSYFVNKNLQSGRIANKHSYIVCQIKDCWNETAVQEAAKRIESALKQISNESYRCSEKEMEKILVELYNPLRPEVYISY